MKKYLLFLLFCMFNGSLLGMDDRLVNDDRPETYWYTKHAREQMAARNVTEDDVERVIASGESCWDTEKNSFIFDEVNNRTNELFRVVLNKEKTGIITVIRREQYFKKPVDYNKMFKAKYLRNINKKKRKK